MQAIDSSRYIQYRAAFNSDDPGSTVALYDIDIWYGIHATEGTGTSILIPPIDLHAWERVFYTSTLPTGTSLTVDVLAADDSVLIPNVSTGDSLAGIDPSHYPSIKLRATLGTPDPSLSPEIDVWGVEWTVSKRQYLPLIFR
jgi:hypothetical protein